MSGTLQDCRKVWRGFKDALSVGSVRDARRHPDTSCLRFYRKPQNIPPRSPSDSGGIRVLRSPDAV
ncbi:MAG: hypothetical protein FLDDKLPJ_00640 [Phycisphaerae bacterium]|nr:hypothetical protein [Phycisphaerae bacterium]